MRWFRRVLPKALPPRLVSKGTACRIKQAVQEGQYTSARMRIVNRTSKNEAICLFCFCSHKIDLIIIKYTAAQLSAGTAADTVADGIFSKLDDLSLHTFLV